MRVEKIEKLLESWKKARDDANKYNNKNFYTLSKGAVEFGEEVIKILDELSLNIQEKPKHHYRHCGANDHNDRAEYCYSCGGKL